MGTYLNPGKQNYEISAKSEIFIDKTEMISYLNTLVNTNQRFVSVSRPRRFGKTMAADMIYAYYGREADSRKLFEKLNIANHSAGNGNASWDLYLGKFDVIWITLTDFMGDCDNTSEMLQYLTEEVTDELRSSYTNIDYGSKISLRTVMSRIYGKTNRQFVIVIDEWDAAFRTWKKDEEGHKKYLDFLRDLMKDKPYIALAYMTGSKE